MALTRDRDTVEYLWFEFTDFTVNGQPAEPPASYELAAVPAGTRPTVTEWQAGPWLAGPMVPGTYDMYLRFADTPEVPVRRVATLIVT